jgi:hypothetical protein
VQNILDPGWNHHEIRMVIFHEPREPLSVAHWKGEGAEHLETKNWESVNTGDNTLWNTADANGLTLEQVLSSIKSEFCRTVEADR